MDAVNRKRWVTTAEAAALLGYCPDHFRRKFEPYIPTLRIFGGHLRWDREAIEKLVEPKK